MQLRPLYERLFLEAKLLFHTKLFKCDCETSNLNLCKSSLNPFLEPTSTKQWGLSFLLKETTRAFDGAPTHDWPITSQTRYLLRHARPLFSKVWLNWKYRFRTENECSTPWVLFLAGHWLTGEGGGLYYLIYFIF